MATNDERAKASDFHPEVLRLFDQYVHHVIDRAAFLDKAAPFAGGGTAADLLQALSPRFAESQKVAETDPRIETESVEFASPAGYGRARGYLTRPAASGGKKLPSVLVIHENRGLNPHIEDIARRLALEGFLAFAPDALFTLGGYPGDEDKARELFSTLEQPKSREDFVAAAGVLKARPESGGKVAVIGFCYGGSISNLLATRLPNLAAAVPFYGGAAPLDKVGDIRAPLQLHFAESDERVNASWPPYEAALKTAGVRYEAFFYPGTQHGFNNDTTPRYDPAAAQLSWQRAVDFLRASLG
jgi:carboxymethylenebutenolidase